MKTTILWFAPLPSSRYYAHETSQTLLTSLADDVKEAKSCAFNVTSGVAILVPIVCLDYNVLTSE
jgi:hypothetical protein